MEFNTNQTDITLTKNASKKQIIVIYSGIALVIIVMFAYFVSLGKISEKRAIVVAAEGVANSRLQMKQTIADCIGKNKFFEMTGDIQAVNQLGEEVSMQDLKGKVWVFAQFYGSCPECNSTNLGVLKELYDKYKGDDDFQIVTVSVKADEDAVTLMKNMADGYEASAKNWWFLSADVDQVNVFCQKEMGYMKFEANKVKLNPEPEDMLGEINHDMGIAVFDAEMGMWAKVDLFSPMKAEDKLEAELAKDKLFLTVDWCLDKLKNN